MEMITENSTLKEVYENPVGHDVLQKLLMQYGVDDAFLQKGVMSHTKLKTVMRLASKVLPAPFWETFFNLVNVEPDMPLEDDAKDHEKVVERSGILPGLPAELCGQQ